MPDIFWTFEYEGERMDLECATRAELEAWLDDWFAAKFDDEDMRNGETREDEGEIIQYSLDDDGNVKDLLREKHGLFYERERSDFEEHSTWNKIGTGVI